MEIIKLNASKREVSGKKVKQLRVQGLVPAVVYGHGVESVSLAIDAKEFEKAFQKAGESTLVDLAVNGGESAKVLVQDVQYDPLKGTFVHVDFRQVNMKEKMEVEIPLRLVGEAPVVREQGATLVRALDTVNVRCLPQDLVHEIEVPLDGLKAVGDSIAVGDLKVPAGLEVINEPEEMIVIVNATITEDEIKAMESASGSDVTAVKVEGEEKKIEKEAAEKAEAKPEKK
jgi:large subunit ribosomal protein L25